MSRWVLALLLALPLSAQKKEQKQPQQQEQAPPEEDENVIAKEYSFNPLQAAKELKVGNFYFKKGSYRAAAVRFLEATKWNDKLPDAWLRLGEAREKMKNNKAACEAFKKYLELSPDAKNGEEIRKKVAKLESGG